MTKRAPSTKQSVGKNGVLQIHQAVDESQCAKWTAIINRNQKHWIQRAPGAWSFGNAWYYDVEQGLAHRYFANAMMSNRKLQRLPGFVATMLEATQYLRDPRGRVCKEVRARHQNLGPYWCESGIHIYTENYGAIHADFEGLICYPKAMLGTSTCAYTAILSIAQPPRGGGLTVWKRRVRASEKEMRIPKKQQIEFNYCPGTMTILDSFFPHKIQPSIFDELSPQRITGVMHFLHLSRPYPHWEYWF